MKKLFFILLALMLCVGLSGCISIKSADVEASASPDTIAPPVPEQVTEAAEPPAAAETSESGAPAVASSGQRDRISGLAAHYPRDRVPFPEGSGFVKATNIEDTDKYIEYTYVTLPMTKAEAIDYFSPLLEKDADFFQLDDNLEYVPLEILGAYPDAASFASLYSRYTQQTEANISVIMVNLYTPADGETVLVAEIQVNYRAKP